MITMRSMNLMLLCLMILAGLLPHRANAQESEGAEFLVRNIRYSYDRQPTNDPDNNRLTDGKAEMVGPWHHTLTTDVTLDLRQGYMVTRVETDIYRGNLMWLVKELSLFVDKEGEFELARKMETNLKVKVAGPNTFTFDNVNTTTQRLRLRYNNDGYYFSIREIRVYAQKQPQRKQTKTETADGDALKPYTVPASGEDLLFAQGNYDGDPAEELFVANRFFQIMLEPGSGGVIGSFNYHGVEMTQPKNPAAPGGGGGYFADHVNVFGGRGDWWEAVYDYQLIEQSPERVIIKLSSTGRSGSLMYLTINKTVTVWRDRSYTRVDYDFELAKEATTSLPFRFLFLNYVGTRDGLVKSKANAMLIPENDGLVRYNYAQDDSGNQAYWYNPARGWSGFVDVDRDTGVIFGLDYRYVDFFYSWGCTNHNGLPTLEWRFNNVTIKDGDSFKTTAYIMPFRGFEDVAGGGGRMVGGLSCDRGKVNVQLISGRSEKVEAELRYLILPDSKWQDAGRKTFDVNADEPVGWEVPLEMQKPGTYVFSVVVKDDTGEELLEMEKPAVVDAPSGRYVLRPREERIVEAQAQVKTDYTSMDYETPHVKWAKPYHRGKIKALILIDGRYQREVIEVAQRMDLDFDTTYLYGVDIGEAIADYYGRTSGGDLKAGMKRLFRENPEWEVMLMAGHMLKYFDPDQLEIVYKRIEEGAGLVVVQPEPMDAIEKLSPLQKIADKGAFLSKWHKIKPHFITTGVPLDSMPPTHGYVYEKTADAEVLATLDGGSPLIAVRQYGKGRVVAMAYRSGDRREPKSFFGVMPFMSLEGRGADICPLAQYDYHEYQFSLLAKAVIWAAAREPDLQIRQMTVEGKQLELQVENRGEKMTVEVESQVKNKYGTVIGETQSNMSIGSGGCNLTVPLPEVIMDGLSFANVFIRDKEKKVVNWGTAAVPIEQAVKIGEVNGIKDVYYPGDKVELTVGLEGKAEAGMAVAMRLWDGYDRLLADERNDLGQDHNAKFTLTLDEPINRMLVIELKLCSDKGTVDVYRGVRPLELPYKAKAEVGDPAFMGWSVITYYGLNNYLHNSYVKRLQEIGFNRMMVMVGDAVDTYRQSIWRYNMPIQRRTGGLGRGKTTGDPEHPSRDYCPNNPEVRRADSAQVGGSIAKPNVYSYQYGDEALFASDGVDTCFCEHCMARMRGWLKERYVDLGGLNETWGTDYAGWDDVRPLTLKEVRNRGDENYASWADHRRFNEYSMADFYNMLRKTAEQKKTWARFGVSGDFGPGAYSGQDTWLWRNCMSHLEAYSAFDEFDAWRDESRDIEIRKYGNFAPPDVMREMIYGYMFSGVNGMAVCGTQRLPNFDWTLSGVAQGYQESWKPIAQGIGRIMNKSRRVRESVAVYYSRNDSARVAYLQGFNAMWSQMPWDLRKMVYGSGFDINWIAYGQLERGMPSECRVLILPMTMSLSELEAVELRKFVSGGGVLIGQMAIGVADANCRMLKGGMLDDVFGIKRQSSKIVKRSGKIDAVESFEGLRFPEIEADFVETGLENDGAAILARTQEEGLPVAFVCRYGKGLALYLGCNLTDSYKEVWSARGVKGNAEIMEQVEQFVQDVMAKGRVSPILDIIGSEGNHPAFVRVVNFRDGLLNYFGVMRHYRQANDYAREPQQVRIRFPMKGYIRELFSGRDAGWTDSVDTLITPTTLQLYAVLPYEVEGLDFSLSKKRFKVGECVRYSVVVRAASAKPGDHVVRMRVIDPQEEESEPYTRNISTNGGEYSGEIRLALNDKPGKWTIEVVDLASGKKNISKMIVE